MIRKRKTRLKNRVDKLMLLLTSTSHMDVALSSLLYKS